MSGQERSCYNVNTRSSDSGTFARDGVTNSQGTWDVVGVTRVRRRGSRVCGFSSPVDLSRANSLSALSAGSGCSVT